MAKGPQGRKLPHDVVSNAIKFIQNTSGEAEFEDDEKDAATRTPGAKGDKARAAHRTPKQRCEIARKAAAKRWSSDPSETPAPRRRDIVPLARHRHLPIQRT